MALRIATFNLMDFFPPQGPEEQGIVGQKVDGAVASLRRANADVVALQEVGDDAMARKLSELAGYGPPVVGSADKRGIRNAILSRLPVLWSQVHQSSGLPFPKLFEGDPEPFGTRIPLRRGVVHVRVDGGALGEVDVLTAHFKSNLPAALKKPTGEEIPDVSPFDAGQSAVRSLVQRAAEALYVRGLVDNVFAQSPDHAICVLGDLNDRPDSLPVRLVRGMDPSHRHHLHSAHSILARELCFSTYHGGGPILIDHILLSGRLNAALKSYEIHNESLRDHGPHDPNAPISVDSDHALCVAELG
jgi:endonuclease/exonuclease/phosphatase family metal-dependent hydrolase